MACVVKRRGKWVVDFRDHEGKRRWETYETRREADDALAKRIGEVKGGVYRAARDLRGRRRCLPPRPEEDRSMRRLLIFIGALLFAARVEAAAPTCVGDCNGDSRVSIDELVTAVNIALGTEPLDECRAADCTHEGHGALITCLVQAVNLALTGGCGPEFLPTPTATPSVTPIDTATPTIEQYCGVGCFATCIPDYGPDCPCSGACFEFLFCGSRGSVDLCDDTDEQYTYCFQQLCTVEIQP
jgi:hypothetical protein